MQRTAYMVLDDGKTYSQLAGCRIISWPASYTAEEVAAAMAGDPDLKQDRIVHKTFNHQEQAEFEEE